MGEATIMPVSQQEIVSDQIEDFCFSDGTELMTTDLFNWDSQIFNSRISVKCPLVDSNAQYKRLLQHYQETDNFKTSSRNVDIDVSIEISKHLELLKDKSDSSETHLDVEESEKPEIEIANPPELPQLQIEGTEASEPATEKEVEVDENICSNNNASDAAKISEKVLKLSENQSNVTPSRRSSRRAPNEKYNLALQILKPKASKVEIIDDTTKKVECFDENSSMNSCTEDKNQIVKDDKEFTYKLEKEDNLTTIGSKSRDAEPSEGCLEPSKNLSIDDEINLINHSKGEVEDQGEGYTSTRSIRRKRQVRPKIKIEDDQPRKKRKGKVIVKADGEVIPIQDENNQESKEGKPQAEVSGSEMEKTFTIDDLENGNVDVFADLSDTDNDEEFVLDGKNENEGRKNSQSTNPFATLQSTCKICSVVLAPGGLAKHMKQHIGDHAKNVFKCPTCGKIAPSEVKLKLHQNTHMSENSEGKFECEKCHKMYSTKSALFKHRRTGLCATEFECSICFVSFSCEQSLEKHNNHFHSEKSLAHLKCKLCNKRFVTRGGLKRHMALKQCNIDLSCHICKRTFLKSSAFQTHMLKHQANESQDVKTYQCDLCGNFLGSYHSLKKHVSRHLNIRNQECTICHKKFLDLTELRTHMRTHSKEKPYICDICPQRFGQSGHMLRHKLQVHKIGKFPFVCDTCGKGFVDRRNIIMHTKMHENRAKRQLEKPSRKKKVKVASEPLQNCVVKTEPAQIEESNVIQIDGGYDITELLGAHVTQTNSDGSQTIISSGNNLQSIEHILQAASENPSNVEYISAEEIPVDQNYGDQPQGYISIDNIKVENPLLDNDNIVYTIEDGGTVQSIPASDLGILAETAQQFQNSEEITYYIIKKE